MKISKSKQELARIISENGGWRDGAELAAQDKDGEVFGYCQKPRMGASREVWGGDGCTGPWAAHVDTVRNWHQTILSRDEYFHLYPVADVAPEPVAEVKPTIEQLATDYRNLKDFADRKQQEADAAKADAEAKLAELVASGKALGLVLSVVGVREPTGKFYSARLGIDAVYNDDTNDVICDECGGRWGVHYEDESYCKPRSERENA